MQVALINPRIGFRSQNERLMRFWHATPEESPFRHLWSAHGLGLLTVAALTPPSDDVVVIDENHEVIDFDGGYDLVGITAMTQQAVRTYEIADAFRARGATVVIGGIHATVLPDEASQHCDAVVVGEAEATWPRLLDDFKHHNLQPCYRSPGPVDLSDSPIPAYDKLDPSNYRLMTIQTTRGCPHACDFCVSSTVFGSSHRMKTPDQVMREIDAMVGHFGEKHIFWSDDNFFVNRRYARELLERLCPRRLRWFAQSDISIGAYDDLLELARQSGCVSIFIGLESVNPGGLSGFDDQAWKAKQLPKYQGLIRNIQEHGVGVFGAFVVGFDQDDETVLERTTDFILENNLYAAIATILTLFPGTPLRERLECEGRILPSSWDNYTAHDMNITHPVLSKEQLEEGLCKIYERVYSEDAYFKRMEPFKAIHRRLAQSKSV